jgi:hypothetical protein
MPKLSLFRANYFDDSRSPSISSINIFIACYRFYHFDLYAIYQNIASFAVSFVVFV